MANQPRGRKNPSTRGDFTGNKKEALQKEHEETVSQRRDEIGLVTANRQAVKDEGVIDLMEGTPKLELDNPELEQSLREQLEGQERVVDEGQEPVNGRDGDGEDASVADAVGRPLQVDPTAREPQAFIPPAPAPETGTRIGSGTSTLDVFELEPERPQAAQAPGEVLTAERQNEPTLIRSLYDVEDVTIGYGNTYTFREGYRYKVPRWVAAHLEEKGLCNVLSLSLT